MSHQNLAVIGGGAAGIFAAATAATAAPGTQVSVFEKGHSFLSKVRISGGGRCNVTHACFDPRELSQRYPRGGRELIGPFHRFQPRDTIEWFESRGVKLKTEEDGRIFPVTDASQTIIDCLLDECQKTGVRRQPDSEVLAIERQADGLFRLQLNRDRTEICDRLLLASGGLKSSNLQSALKNLGHSIEPPVPSLFTFHVELSWLRELAGVSVPNVRASVADDVNLHQNGPLLITHWGLSGPAILKLSAWGARALNERGYRFEVSIDWLPEYPEEALKAELAARRTSNPARQIVNVTMPTLPLRLWKALLLNAGIPENKRWSNLSSADQHQLVQLLKHSKYPVTGKSMNKEEFVTCGGVRLNEVNFKTMESRLVPGLFFAGEALDIDGVTGGFNFQAAWTTGRIAGQNLIKG